MNNRILAILVMTVSLFPQHKARSVLHVESLEYPSVPLGALLQGEVTVHAEVEADGHVRSALLESGPLVLGGAAIENVRAWKFEPGEKEYIDVTYRFMLTEPKVMNPHTICKFDLPNAVTVIANLPLPETTGTR